MAATTPPADLAWQDGVPHSPAFGDRYYSDRAWDETTHVFLHGNDLPGRWRSARRFVAAELGFGTGLNALATIAAWRCAAPADATLDYVAIEAHPLRPDDMIRALTHVAPNHPGLIRDLCAVCADLHPGPNLRVLAGGRVRLLLLIGDVHAMLTGPHGHPGIHADAWFLDGFAPALNPAMWSTDVLAGLTAHSAPAATLATFTAAGHVRRTLQAAGWSVTKRDGFGRKREMLTARLDDPADGGVSSAPWFGWPAATPATHARVIGGGLAGAASARALAERGVAVTVDDAGGPAPSNLPAVLVRDYTERGAAPRRPFYQAACHHAVHRLAGWTGWHPTGVALLDHRDRLHATPETTRRAETSIGAPLAGNALWLERGGWMDPGRIRAGLLDHPGIAVRTAAATDLPPDPDMPTILAPGAGGTAFAPLRQLPTRRSRGQMTGLAHGSGLALRAPLAGGGLAVDDGAHVWLGSSFIRGDADAGIRPPEAERYLAGWRASLPMNDNTANCQHRAGVRVTTADRMPLIGPMPDITDWLTRYADLHHGRSAWQPPAATWWPNLWVNWGHGARGATAALLCGETIAAAMTGAPLPLDTALAEAVHPARFTVRTLRRPPATRR